MLIVLAVPTWLAVALLPSPPWCWRVLRTAGGPLRRLCGIPLSVAGVHELGRVGPCVLVATHASYLDGLALVLALPCPVVFVAAADLAPRLLSGTLLKRLGCEFVARRARSDDADVPRLAAVLHTGRSLVIFPEGSLSRAPGLRPFRLGAFAVAASAGVPVMPVGIRGTRDLLAWSPLPSQGRVDVAVGDPIAPCGRDWPAVLRLRDAARQAVLAACGEHAIS